MPVFGLSIHGSSYPLFSLGLDGFHRFSRIQPRLKNHFGQAVATEPPKFSYPQKNDFLGGGVRVFFPLSQVDIFPPLCFCFYTLLSPVNAFLIHLSSLGHLRALVADLFPKDLSPNSFCYVFFCAHNQCCPVEPLALIRPSQIPNHHMPNLFHGNLPVR